MRGALLPVCPSLAAAWPGVAPARTRLALLVAAVLVLASVEATPAPADVFGPISLSSQSSAQQADYARDPAISGDGRYVAFDGSFGGVTGVWRKDLQSGAVQEVAGGDAELPSISQNGQYVSFTTTSRLSPHDHNEAPDVYVADLLPGSAEPEYELASAVDGSEEGLLYEGRGEATRYGALARGRYALSADGRKVVFVTTSVSNLDGPGTPAMQVAMRDLETDTTQLVSAAYPPSQHPEPVSGSEGSGSYGAAYEEGGQVPPFLPVGAYAAPRSIGASISADGSTVAWLGQNVADQVRLLPGESAIAKYEEPLWRRIADGPLAPTRRITGGSDPEDPACVASGESAIGELASPSDPCQGPFATYAEKATPGTGASGIGNFVPCLSADGYTVAFLATAPLVSFGDDFGNTENTSNLYIADMHPGLTRDGALRALTEPASGLGSDLATNAPVIDLGISADAEKVAFTTMRTVFPLGAPSYVSAPAPVPGMAELFDVDLGDETLTRVTQGYEGGASEQPHVQQTTGEDPYFKLARADGALSPSYSSSGDTLEFASTAANLVYGDGNTPPASATASREFDGSDAFSAPRIEFGSQQAEGYVSSPPATSLPVPEWRLEATAFSRRDGSVLIEVQAPGAGSLRAVARALVPVARVGVVARSHHGARRRRLASVAARTVASVAVTVRAPGLATLVARPYGRYRALVGALAGLSASVNLTFTAQGHPPLHERIMATFAQVRAKARRAVTVGRGRAHAGGAQPGKAAGSRR
ncbi:MAG TPA: hypothetical protein VHU13_03575 [Solirubrobacteraceae bacterium]|jgi:hypothetical protein|nr:hypothetical protein [Solirubrobacteraceae bacterium]